VVPLRIQYNGCFQHLVTPIRVKDKLKLVRLLIVFFFLKKIVSRMHRMTQHLVRQGEMLVTLILEKKKGSGKPIQFVPF
jgi:hypothetical protein